MFNSFSWEQYLIFIATILTLYYLSILLLYFRMDFAAIFTAKKGNLSHSKTEPKYYNPFTPNPDSFMGSINPEKVEDQIYIKTKENGEANITQVEDSSADKEHPVNAEPPLSSDTFLLGTIADLVKEIKTLIQLLSENGGIKEDFLKMVATLLARYHNLKDTAYQDTISIFLVNECKGKFHYEISLDEIKMLWN